MSLYLLARRLPPSPSRLLKPVATLSESTRLSRRDCFFQPTSYNTSRITGAHFSGVHFSGAHFSTSSKDDTTDGTTVPAATPWFVKVVDFFAPSAPMIRKSESLFATALSQVQSNKVFIREGKIKRDFKSKHMVLLLHVWCIHRRLIANIDGDDDRGKQLQEQLFDRLWDDTTTRIRAQVRGGNTGDAKAEGPGAESELRVAPEMRLCRLPQGQPERSLIRPWLTYTPHLQGLPELTVNSHLKNVQKYSFAACVSFDHALTFDDNTTAGKAKALDELGGALWREVYQRNDNLTVDHVMRLAKYVDSQLKGIMAMPAAQLFEHGQVKFEGVPDFSHILDDEGVALPDVTEADIQASIAEQIEDIKKEGGTYIDEESLEEGWRVAYTEAGKLYYWNVETRESSWDAPFKNK